ncbi:TPA: hypothetical protein ACIULI_004074 [Salmonella enterica subsp. enterica serovar Javiana]|uniref:Prophage protein n=1 Tax=Salmonella enterica TaxID=28901 RepID=A0A755X6J7_SALER|nr:hypothetical protein [Salmonella enterica subsp. enterica serovar Thompson]EHI3275322.1 hypothetical protein [Salmonella enterica]ECY7948766.1 hypothetical protein [Salmonella enterica subsp. enterica serovar Thompson]EHI7757852.1 hypothetical protein [Salmonella enterica]EHI8762348.1 hypothetical protein [Salmonella enterica]
MFDFPQPGEIYRCTGFPDVVVVGVLAAGIPWDMPYRCPALAWNPYRRTYSILVRTENDDHFTEIPLGRFLQEFTCVKPDLFKRCRENRYAVLKEITFDPELQKWRAKNLDIYPEDITPSRRPAPAARKWRDIPRTEPEIKSDNSYRHYL